MRITTQIMIHFHDVHVFLAVFARVIAGPLGFCIRWWKLTLLETMLDHDGSHPWYLLISSCSLAKMTQPTRGRQLRATGCQIRAYHLPLWHLTGASFHCCIPEGGEVWAVTPCRQRYQDTQSTVAAKCRKNGSECTNMRVRYKFIHRWIIRFIF